MIEPYGFTEVGLSAIIELFVEYQLGIDRRLADRQRTILDIQNECCGTNLGVPTL